jgi:hypothetical protein
MSALHFTAWRQSYKVEARRLAETTNKREKGKNYSGWREERTKSRSTVTLGP